MLYSRTQNTDTVILEITQRLGHRKKDCSCLYTPETSSLVKKRAYTHTYTHTHAS